MDNIQMLSALENRVRSLRDEQLQLLKQANEAVSSPITHIQLYGLLTGGLGLVSQTQTESSKLYWVIGLLTVAFVIGMVAPFVIAFMMIFRLSSMIEDLGKRYELLKKEIASFKLQVTQEGDVTQEIASSRVTQQVEEDIEMGSASATATAVGNTQSEIEETQDEEKITHGEVKKLDPSRTSLLQIFVSLEQEVSVDTVGTGGFRSHYYKLLLLQGASALIFVISIPLLTSFMWNINSAPVGSSLHYPF